MLIGLLVTHLIGILINIVTFILLIREFQKLNKFDKGDLKQFCDAMNKKTIYVLISIVAIICIVDFTATISILIGNDSCLIV